MYTYGAVCARYDSRMTRRRKWRRKKGKEDEKGEEERSPLLIPGTLNDYSSLLNCLYFHSSRPRRLFEVLISTLDPESIVTLHKLLPRARAEMRIALWPSHH